MWGPTPIINIKYWSRALQALGIRSDTIVWEPYSINAPDDFDARVAEMPPTWNALRLLRPYVAAARALARYTVFCWSFDGGLLAHTPLAALEPWLVRLARARVIVSPYGSDIAVPGTLGPFEEAMLGTYPTIETRAAVVRRKVRRYSKAADLVVRNLQVGYLPRWDVFWPGLLAIDTDLWAPGPSSDADGSGPEEVLVVHSANHPLIKGTAHLVAAVEVLRGEGLAVRLDLYEGRSNEDVRRAVMSADIVADQFVGGYGMAALEGLSSGKPVLSNLSWLGTELTETMWRRDCPIVDAPPSALPERLRELVRDPRARRRIGEASREFALRYHSLQTVGVTWRTLIDHAVAGSRPPRLLPTATNRFGTARPPAPCR